MWCSELDREVDPLEIPKALLFLRTHKYQRYMIDLTLQDYFSSIERQAGEGADYEAALDEVNYVLDDWSNRTVGEATIISNLGEGDEYDPSNAHRRPDGKR